MVNRRQMIKSAAAAATVLAIPKYAFAQSFNGFYPAGSWIPAKQPMIQVYPRPDSETNTWARHHWAYYDGVNPVQYKIPLGVSFGAFPYVFQLLSGPPGMTIGATYWQSGWSFAQALGAGYGYLLWTPTAAVSNAKVSILVTDQQMNTLTITFTVSTSSSTSQFIFLDAANGNDSTGTGTISAPWQTLAKAFGSTYAATTYPGAICYLRGTGTYTAPVHADQNINTYWAICEINTSRKPAALIGFPGDSLPVISLANAFFASYDAGADLFFQDLAPNGYKSAGNSCRFFWVAGYGSNASRNTFDGNTWTNSGYGASAASNATGYFIDSTTGVSSYHFINGCSETNRQSGNAGNNYGGCSFYNVNNALVQGNVINDPTLTIDEAWQPKSDVSNGCWRGNTTIVSAVQYAYSPLQQVYNGFANFEICYNTLVASVGAQIAVPVPSAPGTFTNIWCYRNSVSGPNGLVAGVANSNGPYVFQSNAVQTAASQPSGNSVQTSSNVYKTSGLLSGTTGGLTSTYSSYLGTVGAQIALTSSAATPNPPLNLKIA